jgi:hypothetical protein
MRLKYFGREEERSLVQAVEGRDPLERADPLAPQIEYFGEGATT